MKRGSLNPPRYSTTSTSSVRRFIHPGRLTTSEGIILIDTLFTYNSEEEIVGGLKSSASIRQQVKYVIISHAHGDHDGGAKLMQDRFGSHIVMGEPDWTSMEKSVNRYPEGKPKRDIVADDGQKITLGDTTCDRSSPHRAIRQEPCLCSLA